MVPRGVWEMDADVDDPSRKRLERTVREGSLRALGTVARPKRSVLEEYHARPIVPRREEVSGCRHPREVESAPSVALASGEMVL